MLNPNNNDLKHQSHGLTVAEMKDLQIKQTLGQTDLIRANRNPDILINKVEKHLIHVSIEDVQFDPKTGRRLSKPAIQKFDVKDFEKMSRTQKIAGKPFDFAENAFGGYETKILHDPRVKADDVPEYPASETIDQMTEEELRLNYRTVTGNNADPEDNKDMLVILLKEAIEAKKH